MAGKIQYDLTGMTFNTWDIEKYLGKSKYIGRCRLCGAQRELDGYFLKTGKIPKCDCETGKSNKGRIDLTGKHFGDWEVLEYAGDKKWKCRCLCGCNTIKNIAGSDLRNGKSTGCGRKTNKRLDDLTGRTFGEWEVLGQAPPGNHSETMWHCRCSCGVEEDVTAYALKSGSSKSCGHGTTGLKDLTGMVFGNWLVLGRSSKVSSSSMWLCECLCESGTLQDVSGYALRSGTSKSCGCLSNSLREASCLSKYGVNHVGKIGTTRTPEQLRMVETRENVLKAIQDNFDFKPTAQQLGDILGISRCSVKDTIHKFGLEDYMQLGTKNVSGYERALAKLFPCEHYSDRTVLDGKELDLYYPDKQFAIEFNGNYWHSDLKKSDIKYHQNKSIAATKKGVQIFHIFEYEWLEPKTKEKIVQLINNRLYPEKLNVVHARNCEIAPVGILEERGFLNNYHIQGFIRSEVCIGLKHNGELLGLMSFGKPRFDINCQYELLRMAWKLDTAVTGGSERIFKHFINEYNPSSVVSYCDISKFNGNSYSRLGFKATSVTAPNYKWIDVETSEVISRYQTQKHILIEKGFGDLGNTEVEIMQARGFNKIYDCGNIKFIWTQQ